MLMTFCTQCKMSGMTSILLFIGYINLLLYPEVLSGVSYPASHGSNKRRIMTVFKDNVTWLQAYEHCEAGYGQLSMPEADGSFLLYTRHELFNRQLLKNQPLWIAFIKPFEGNTWYRASTCNTLSNFYHFDHDQTKAGDCALLAMESDSAHVSMWPTANCEEKHPFVCVKNMGVSVPYGTWSEKKIAYSMPGWTETINNKSFGDCRTLLENTYDYAAMYYNGITRKCSLVRGYIYDFPLNVMIENGEASDTVVIKTGIDQVEILDGTLYPGADNSVLPCTDESTTMDSVTSTTGMSMTTGMPMTTGKPTTEVQETTGHAISTLPDTTTSSTTVVETTTARSTAEADATTAPTTSKTTTAESISIKVPPSTKTESNLTNDDQTSCVDKEKSMQKNDSTCTCSLVPVVKPTSAQKEDVQELISDIQEENTLDKKATSSFKRTLTSAKDDRTSSKAIGLTGVIVMASVGALIVLSDIPILVSTLRHIWIKPL